ncbi:heptaprenylglyceryl phosphate synthase [Halorussus lipolyticus]|uniref:heptaprenylglyceryl phosphate synthase n=1 Tax=Halorussus lipolyticus TaxID=3034024 RepID=UPI0023E8E3E6|nr:heptaprenylglyceryl phosphate synthase [Halorussus sp. DT80]
MTSLDGTARLFGRVARGIGLAGRTVLPVDTNPVPADWTHVTKVDPEEAKKLPLLYPLYLRHTSAVSVGGSADVTAENTEETFDLLAPASVPVFHEPSGPRHVTPRTRAEADLLAIPEVLNGDSESLVGQLGAGTEYIRDELVPDLLADELPWLPGRVADALADFATSWLLSEAVFEAYIIQNPDSAAAREANVDESDLLSPREAKQRAMAAERHLESELVYLEYSGTYGGDEATDTLAAIADSLSWSRLWYGGGIDSRERAEDILDAGADAIVVGDAFHRVADEEADLCERAADALDAGVLDSTADESAVREWVRDEISVADSNAVAYLATIPAVSNPVLLAEAYLTATVRTWLLLHARSADDADLRLGREAGEDLRTALGSDLLASVDEDDLALIRRSLRAVLGDGATVSTGASSSGLATTHFALSLSSR